jgi:hypothetical protein
MTVEDVYAHPAHLVVSAADLPGGRFQCVHDDRLVLASSLQGSATPFGDFH